MRIAQFINIFLFALVSGLWGTWFSLSRSIASITPAGFLEIGRTMIRNLAWPMRILMPASILSALAVLFLLFHSEPAGAFYVELAGFLLFIGVLLVTLLINVPIDNRIKRWSLETLPSDWKSIRDRWELYHAVRTFASLGGFGCVLASALFF
jgi:uncharacterized membrane protein